MATKEKQLTRMEVDGHVVRIEPITPDILYRYNDGTPRYGQRSAYEVYVDDALRGYVWFPTGYGGRWYACSLRWGQRYDPGHAPHDETELAKGRFGQYQPVLKSLSPGALNETENWGEHKKYWDDRNEILRAFPRMIELGRAPTVEEVAAQTELDKKDFAARIAKAEADKIRWAEEAAERERQRVIAAQKAEEERAEVEAGLESINERFRTQLSNFEIAALERALQQWRKK